MWLSAGAQKLDLAMRHIVVLQLAPRAGFNGRRLPTSTPLRALEQVAHIAAQQHGLSLGHKYIAAQQTHCSARWRIVIAKLDRLSRNVHFMSGLMERKVNFVACDMPSANAFMINIYAAVAQEERRMISERTKAALGSGQGARGEARRTQDQCHAMGGRYCPCAGHCSGTG
jgi:hypothetical protein